MKAEFEMTVSDRFSFADGRTVFTGMISGTDALIRSCLVDVFSGDLKIATITVEDEMLTESRGQNPSRALSTRDKFDYDGKNEALKLIARHD